MLQKLITMLLIAGFIILGYFIFSIARDSYRGSRIIPTKPNKKLDKPLFPVFETKNLSGDLIKIPEDLEANYNLMVFAFYQNQQNTVNTWIPYLEPLVHQGKFQYYELPTVGDFSLVGQKYLDGIMNAGIPDKEMKNRTLTVYKDREKFLEGLGIKDFSRVYLVLIDKQGNVLKVEEGDYSFNKLKSITDIIK